MNQIKIRRFKRLHEVLLLSGPSSWLIGFVVVVLAPVLLLWGWDRLWNLDAGQRTALILVIVAFVSCKLLIDKSQHDYPGARTAWLITPTVGMTYAAIYITSFVIRYDVSRALLLSSGFLALAWFLLESLFTNRYRVLKLAIVPGGETDSLLELPGLDGRMLKGYDLAGYRYDGVVADFSCIEPEAERFLTRCALDRVAVYNSRQVFESLTGRVKIDRMSENTIGSLLPSHRYEVLKLVFDYIVVALSAVIVVPLCLLAMVAIRLESPGRVIYSQQRVGLGNREFTIYKLRSMRFDKENATEQFAGEDDPRITRVGKIIRKLRIDELPQFYNVLRGEMSLIGPRPEQPSFVREFDEQIPFYSYRHVVKPGITGWAQVRQGYVANADDTRVKIEHDFYYIKHCSVMLDIYIVFMTVKTMLTGFGAR